MRGKDGERDAEDKMGRNREGERAFVYRRLITKARESENIDTFKLTSIVVSRKVKEKY